MRKALANFAGFLGRLTPAPHARATFQVACVCGQALTGTRKAGYQVLACPRCGQPVFVLPRSPFPPVAPLPRGKQPLQEETGPRRSPTRRWFGPAAAILATVAIVALVFAVLIRHLTEDSPVVPAEEIQARYQAGLQALAAGDFPAAARDLGQTSRDLARNESALTPAEARSLHQLEREAALLADWPGEPLEAVLQRAAPLKDAEWQRVVELSRGKAFVFAIELRRDPADRYHQRFLRPEAGKLLRLELDGLGLLDRLPLQEAKPVLFAARLADVQREAEGPAIVRLVPASGALLTAIPADRLQCLQVPDAAWPQVLARQKQWLDLHP